MLKGLDVLVLLKVAAASMSSQRQLAEALGVPRSSVNESVVRLRSLGLVRAQDGSSIGLNRLSALDFLVNGLRWVAPAEVGDIDELGYSTAESSPRIRSRLMGASTEMVMPSPGGPDRGRPVKPIDERAPAAAEKDPKLLELLGLADAIRVGGARSREVAIQELRACL